MHTILLPASIVLLLLSTYTHTLVTAADVTITATAPPTPTSSQYTSNDDFQSALVDAHNFFREEHNASALTWNETSAKFAANWAKPCNFKHSGGPTGENIAAGFANASAVVDAWANERQSYDFSNPGFSEATGHFTQVVWKATTSVGCGRTDCEGDNGTPGFFVVCEYYPPGNVIGAFAQNVQSQVEGTPKDTVESGVGSAGATRRIPWAEAVGVLCGALGVAVVLW